VYNIQPCNVVCFLQDVDPCDDLSDEDIRTAIQNATGPKNVLFVPEVPFEVLIRRQIARLLDPSLQCARFIYDELVKISHRCETSELQRFPLLRRRIEEVMANFLREGLAPAETMIGHLIEMEMDYINTSHPNFVGGSRAVELAIQQQRGMKDAHDWKESGADRLPLPEKAAKSRAIMARTNAAVVHENNVKGPTGQQEKSVPPGNPPATGSWGIPTIFGNEKAANGNVLNRGHSEPVQGASEPSIANIQLREPPSVLRPNDTQTEQETVEITVTRLLLKSYYDIVRKNIQDSVPKAIMHFLVCHVHYHNSSV
jgi:dynamin 1-like protein